jgi:hypothetical protein
MLEHGKFADKGNAKILFDFTFEMLLAKDQENNAVSM